MPLHIMVPPLRGFKEETSEFVVLKKEQPLVLEHSLVSLSKWESKWKKPLLTNANKTIEESIDYIRCMNLTQNVDPSVFTPQRITNEIIDKVNAYMEDSMTATWFSDNGKGKGPKEVITAEIIYYWMFTQGVPMECQKWHLNRLLTLLRVFSEKNAPKKKMSPAEIVARNRKLNAQRLKRMNTKG